MDFTKLTIATALSATMIGCGSLPDPKSQADINSAYYGKTPTQAQCQGLANRSVGNDLKDPYSAQYRFTSCSKNYLNHYNRYYFGYHIGGTVNGKNSYGGYVGQTRFDVIIQDGVVIDKCIEEAGRETGCKLPYEWTAVRQYAKPPFNQ